MSGLMDKKKKEDKQAKTVSNIANKSKLAGSLGATSLIKNIQEDVQLQTFK